MPLERGMIPPGVQAAKKFNVNRAGQVEGIYQPLYDWQQYPLLGAAVMTFFALPVGQGASVMGAVGPKTYEDTNMEAAGQLPAPKEMLVTSIQVVFLSGAPISVTNAAGAAIQNDYINDVFAVCTHGYLDFFIGSKSYLKDAPLSKFVNDFRLQGFSAAANTNATSQDNTGYATWVGAKYQITPIKLVSNQNFNVTLNWSALVPTTGTGGPTGAGYNGRIGVILGGFQYRLSQ
jgi:hypothetical protein